MAILKIKFNGSINESLQVNDKVYYSNIDDSPNTNITYGIASGDPIYIGTVKAIDTQVKSIDVETDQNSGILPTGTTTNGEFVMFRKNPIVNTCSLSGYYASAKLINDSQDKAELFILSSEVSLSSK